MKDIKHVYVDKLAYNALFIMFFFFLVVSNLLTVS